MSNVPCTRSLGLSGMKTLPPEKQEENTPFILIAKRSEDSVGLCLAAESDGQPRHGDNPRSAHESHNCFGLMGSPCNPLYLKGIAGHGGAERSNFKKVLANDLVL